MGNDHRRIRLIVVNQIHETAVIRFNVAPPCAHFLTLEPEFAELERQLADLGELVMGVRVLRYKDADDAEGLCGLDGIHQ